MNPEQMLSVVATSIKNRTKETTNKWVILYLDGKVQCLPESVIIDNRNIFGYFTDKMLDEGFDHKQWRQLSLNIARFLERKTYKCQHHKP